MTTFIVLISLLIVMMIVGFSVNLYLYSRKALRPTRPIRLEVEAEEEAAEPPLTLHEILFV